MLESPLYLTERPHFSHLSTSLFFYSERIRCSPFFFHPFLPHVLPGRC